MRSIAESSFFKRNCNHLSIGNSQNFLFHDLYIFKGDSDVAYSLMLTSEYSPDCAKPMLEGFVARQTFFSEAAAV